MGSSISFRNSDMFMVSKFNDEVTEVGQVLEGKSSSLIELVEL